MGKRSSQPPLPTTTTRCLYKPDWYVHIGHLSAVIYNHNIIKSSPHGGQFNLVIQDLSANSDFLNSCLEDFNYLFGGISGQITDKSIKVVLLSEIIEEVNHLLLDLCNTGYVYGEIVGTGYKVIDTAQLSEYLTSVNNPVTIKFRLKHSVLPTDLLAYDLLLAIKYPQVTTNNSIFSTPAQMPQIPQNILLPLLDIVLNTTHIVGMEYNKFYQVIYHLLGRKLPILIKHNGLKFLDFNYTYEDYAQAVLDGHLSGKDDPRLLTVAGLRAHQIPPAVISEFIMFGNRKGAISVDYLQYIAKQFKELIEPLRQSHLTINLTDNVIIAPVKVKLLNFRAGETEFLSVRDSSKLITLSDTIYLSAKQLASYYPSMSAGVVLIGKFGLHVNVIDITDGVINGNYYISHSRERNSPTDAGRITDTRTCVTTPPYSVTASHGDEQSPVTHLLDWLSPDFEELELSDIQRGSILTYENRFYKSLAPVSYTDAYAISSQKLPCVFSVSSLLQHQRSAECIYTIGDYGTFKYHPVKKSFIQTF